MIKKIIDIMNKKNQDTENTETEDMMENAAESQEQGTQEETGEKTKNKDGKNSIQLEEKKQELGELKDKYLRLQAEFDNFRKRTVKEKLEFMTTAAQDTVSALLPVLDDFDRARKNAEDESSTEPFSEGVMLVYNKLYKILEQKGVKAMESTGEDFDPELHEAITEIPAPSEEMKGKVIDTVEKGYFLKEKIIRHAKVVVGK